MSKYLSDLEAKDAICLIGHKMYERGFVNGNDGNITVRVGDNVLIATPSGVSKGDLTHDMLLKVDFDGNILENPGNYKVTSEINMHLMVYKHNPAMKATCHAHPFYLSSFATAGIEVDLSSIPASVLLVGKIPVAPYRCAGTMGLAESVIPYVNKYNIVNLGNHGPLTWGTTPMEAWFRLEEAETSCKLAVMTKYTLGRVRPLSRAQYEELMSFHHVPLAPEAQVSAPETTDNGEPAIPFTQLPDPAVRLSDDQLERLADMVVERLKK